MYYLEINSKETDGSRIKFKKEIYYNQQFIDPFVYDKLYGNIHRYSNDVYFKNEQPLSE